MKRLNFTQNISVGEFNSSIFEVIAQMMHSIRTTNKRFMQKFKYVWILCEIHNIFILRCYIVSFNMSSWNLFLFKKKKFFAEI